MKGNEDRRGPTKGHAQNLDKLGELLDSAADSNDATRTSLAVVRGWLNRTGLTGYYKSERDDAFLALTDAHDHAKDVVAELERALRRLGQLP